MFFRIDGVQRHGQDDKKINSLKAERQRLISKIEIMKKSDPKREMIESQITSLKSDILSISVLVDKGYRKKHF